MKIAMVGLGVVGGSFAKALLETNVNNDEIYAIDTNPQTLIQAQAEGTILYGEVENRTILQKADVVFISLYPHDMREFLQEYGSQFKKGAIVTDTVGVKGVLMDSLLDVIPPQVDFIFGHPMAGREKSGYAYSNPNVLKGANYLLTTISTNQKEHIELLKQLIYRMGFKRVRITSPEEHDAMIAFTSQLCHVIAVGLVNSDPNYEESIQFAGDSFRDLTRIAKINEKLWSELFISNKDELLRAIDRFSKELNNLRQAIKAEDTQALQEQFIESTTRREQFDLMDYKVQQQSQRQED